MSKGSFDAENLTIDINLGTDGAAKKTLRGGMNSFDLDIAPPLVGDMIPGGDEDDEDDPALGQPVYQIGEEQVAAFSPSRNMGDYHRRPPRRISFTGNEGGVSLDSPTMRERSDSHLPPPAQDVPEEELKKPALKRVISEHNFTKPLLSSLDCAQHVEVEETDVDEETARAAADLNKCIQRRRKYMDVEIEAKEAVFEKRREPRCPFPSYKKYMPCAREEDEPGPEPYKPLGKLGGCEIKMVRGVFQVSGSVQCPVPTTCSEFFDDLRRTMKIIGTASVNFFASRRLLYLEAMFKLYLLLNEEKEVWACKINPHRDFYNVRKVDTHIHHSACMHPKHLLRFIKKKLKRDRDRVVIHRDGKDLTLAEVFESLNLTDHDLSLDMLDVHADNSTLHRFDRFNLKYNPCGSSRLREIFLKTDNMIGGVYLGEITQELFADYKENKYQMAELRVSIYGRNKNEWQKLATWINNNKLYSDNNRWMIQVPRLYHIHRKTVKDMNNFSTMMANIFEPLFEATRDPEAHPEVSLFLEQVVAFDSVDDESLGEKKIWIDPPNPDTWDHEDNLPYAYYIYYMWANIQVLNSFRRARGLNAFQFRPHAGEAGEMDHMVAVFLLCPAIAHGITLRRSPSLQYLFYLEQIGLCMSPMSNNALFLQYDKNPFDLYFKRGLNVSLSTDDPLQFHLTKEPLIEEYGMAKQLWKYSITDLCEIARNSVLQSGFEDCVKAHWLGENYHLPGAAGNKMERTNIPNIRLAFRAERLLREQEYLAHCAQQYLHSKVVPPKSPSHSGHPAKAGGVPRMVNQAAVIGKQASEKAAEGLWLEAAELFSAAMGAVACADPWCLSGRSECWAELERWEEALADAEQCVQISESNGLGHLRKGLALQGLERHAEAVLAFDKALLHKQDLSKEELKYLNKALKECKKQA